MLERINGFNNSSVLGYYMGKNAVISIAVGSAGGVTFKNTGAVASLAEVQRYLNSTLDSDLLAFCTNKNIVRVDGTAFVLNTIEADYTAAYCAQMNLKRLVDTVQQRAVIHVASDITNTNVSGYKNAPSGVTGTVSITAAQVISFIVERANVFDKDIVSFQGVPTGTKDQGRNLIDDLTSVPMLTSTGTTINLLSSATATDQGNFGIKVLYSIPAIV